MNTITLVGRLASEPELKIMPSGQTMCSFILAVDRQLSREKKEEYKQRGIPTADFPRILTWGRTAETASGYLKKGQRVALEGSLQTGSYEKNGVKIYTCDVIATRIEYLDKADTHEAPKPEYKPQTREEVPMKDSGDFMSLLDDDEVPF